MTRTDHRVPPAHPSRLLAALAGVIAALAGAGAGHLVAGAVAPAASPVIAVGSTVVDLTPTPVKEWAVATFGTADKPILLASVLVVTLLLAGGAGLLAARHRSLGLLALAALAGAATAAALARPAAGSFAIVPGLVTLGVGVASLALLLRLGAPHAATGTAADASDGGDRSMLGASSHTTRVGVDRRRFLVGAGGLAVLGAVAGAAGQALAGAAEHVKRALPRPRRSLPSLPQGLETTVPDVTPLRTSQASFYRVDTALVVPRVDASTWRLSVDGDVDRPFSLSYDELLALPMIERDVTLTCVSNEVGGQYAGGARWLGVKVADLLDQAGVRSGVDQILSTSTDGFTASTPLAALTDDRESLIAVGMNGEALSATHGFPARLLTPGLYGYVGATKWLTTLTATTFAAAQAYWTRRGWDEQAPVKTMARVDTPAGLRSTSAGRVAVAGVAWAQRRGIERVEVSIDESPWQPARLGPDIDVDYWRQWWLPWDATPGQHTIRARAIDGTGRAQTPQRAAPFPNGASGIHEIVTIIT